MRPQDHDSAIRREVDDESPKLKQGRNVNEHSISPSSLVRPQRRGGILPAALLLGLLALLVAIYSQLWIGLLRLPALGGVDFIAFYTAGRVVRANGYGQLYNLDL